MAEGPGGAEGEAMCYIEMFPKLEEIWVGHAFLLSST
jgi:hypothetical protein